MNINVSDFYNSAYLLPGYDPVSSTLARISSLGQQRNDSTQKTDQSPASPSFQVSLSAHSQARALFGAFKSALDGMSTTNKVAPFEAGSSLPGVVSASVGPDAGTAGRYNIEVKQLAKAQTLVTGTYTDPNNSIVGTGRITIETGNYDADNNLFTASSTPAKTIQLDASKGVSGSLNSIANAINSADASIKAEVESVASGGYRLKISTSNSGTENTLRITVADADQNNNDSSGLSVLAYNPTANSGSGKNLTEDTAAQNAVFSVNLKSQTSQSNSVTTAIKDVTLELRNTGSAEITVARSFEAFRASTQKLTAAYNTLLENSAEVVRRAAEAGNNARNMHSKEVQDELGKTLEQASTGTGGQKLMLDDIGITRQADGKLSIDNNKLERSFKANPDGAASLLAGVAQRLSGIVDRLAGASPKRDSSYSKLFAPQSFSMSGIGQPNQPQSLFDQKPSISFSLGGTSLYSLVSRL